MFSTGSLELDLHEFVSGRLMGLADAPGCATFLTILRLSPSYTLRVFKKNSSQAGADGLAVAGKAENQHVTGAAEMKTENAETPPLPPVRQWQQLVRSRDERDRAPDSATYNGPTAHGAALEAKRHALNVHVRRTQGGVPS
jgi:hypothetical protein